MGGKSSQPSGYQTVTNNIDPTIKQWGQNNYNFAQQVAGQQYQPYTGEMVAPLNGVQMGGINNGVAQAAANVGMDAINQGISDANQVAGYSPQQVGTGTWNAQAAQQYMNPYTQSVINATNQQIDQNLAQTNAATNAQATTAGAYGGTRQAVADSQNEYYANQLKAQTAAQLNDQAYTNAQNTFSSDQARALQAATANQQAGLTSANLGLGAADLLGRLGVSQQGVATNNANALVGYGNVLQNQQQNEDQWNYQNSYLNPQNWPLRQLQVLESALGSTPYGTSQTSPIYQNQAASALGGAASGAALGSMVAGASNGAIAGPWGMGIGAALGLLGGIL